MSAAAGAGAGARAKVPVILLAEEHTNMTCMAKNIHLINDIMKELSDGGKKMPPVLFVSEGRGINPCYIALKIPQSPLKDNIIQEHDSGTQTTNEMLDKFMLLTELNEELAQGRSIRDPMGIPIDKEWLLEHMEVDGFKELLMRSDDAYERYKQALDAMEAHDVAEYFRAITDVYRKISIYGLPANETLKANERKMADLKALIRPIIEANGRFAATAEPRKILSNIRETNIIARIEERIRRQPSIGTVVIIFGKNHYDSFVELISRSLLLTLDRRSSNALVGGGRGRGCRRGRSYKRKTYRRKHIKRKSTRSRH